MRPVPPLLRDGVLARTRRTSLCTPNSDLHSVCQWGCSHRRAQAVSPRSDSASCRPHASGLGWLCVSSNGKPFPRHYFLQDTIQQLFRCRSHSVSALERIHSIQEDVCGLVQDAKLFLHRTVAPAGFGIWA